MENKMLRLIESYQKELISIKAKRMDRIIQLEEYADLLLVEGRVQNGISYYNIRRKGECKLKYAGNQSKEMVRRIQELRFLNESLAIIQRDIDLIEDFLRKYESISFQHVNSRLPKAYRNQNAMDSSSKKRIAKEWKKRMEKHKANYRPYKPEELINKTVDGSYVRSKSEALIYNYLFEAGYTFIYELPLEGRTRMFYPDFSILSEIDYKTVIRIEHHGKMNDEDYKNGAEAREYDYWNNGFLPNRDVYFTYDDNKGGFDIGTIIEILMCRVRPGAA